MKIILNFLNGINCQKHFAIIEALISTIIISIIIYFSLLQNVSGHNTSLKYLASLILLRLFFIYEHIFRDKDKNFKYIFAHP